MLNGSSHDTDNITISVRNSEQENRTRIRVRDANGLIVVTLHDSVGWFEITVGQMVSVS